MPSARSRNSGPSRSHKAADPLNPDGLNDVEAAHAELLQASIFVTIAHELDRDERWAERITVLLDSAVDPIQAALEHIAKAIDAIFERRKREHVRKSVTP